jgi:hypothetical protein
LAEGNNPYTQGARDFIAALSRQYQDRYRSSYVYVFILGPLALLGAVVGLAFPKLAFPYGERFAAGLELAALLLISGVVLANYWYRWHERYIAYRLLAELLRAQQELWLLGWSLPIFKVADVAAHTEHAWVGWYFAAVVRAATLPSGRLDTERLKLVRDEIRRNLLSGQTTYHYRRKMGNGRQGLSKNGEGDSLVLRS